MFGGRSGTGLTPEPIAEHWVYQLSMNAQSARRWPRTLPCELW